VPDATLIDVHAHFTTDAYIAAAKAAGHVQPDGMPEDYWPRWTAAEHLGLMERAGIHKAVLSISSPGVHFGDDKAAADLAREVNDAAAAIVDAYPGRFGFFASLPLPAVAAALGELRYALDELGAAGLILMTNSRGRYLGDDRMAPLLAELNRRAAVVLLHPTSAERYPAIKLVIPHAGGVLPLLAERVQLFRSIAGEAADQPSVSQLLARYYFDLAGPPSPPQLDALTAVASGQRLLYGSDYAWTRADTVLRALDGLDQLLHLEKPWREVTSANAQALLS
jgi:predicted TIM-barrel fold metal-dependent hydrolase